jgi:hypothetical protein
MRCARLLLRRFPLVIVSFLLLFAFVPSAGAGPASPAGRVVESEIDRVTVYARNAHVTRTAKVDLTAGIHTFVFDKLPLETHTDALGCHVEGDARVLGIRIERRIYAEPVEERVRALENGWPGSPERSRTSTPSFGCSIRSRNSSPGCASRHRRPLLKWRRLRG